MTHVRPVCLAGDCRRGQSPGLPAWGTLTLRRRFFPPPRRRFPRRAAISTAHRRLRLWGIGPGLSGLPEVARHAEDTPPPRRSRIPYIVLGLPILGSTMGDRLRQFSLL